MRIHTDLPALPPQADTNSTLGDTQGDTPLFIPPPSLGERLSPSRLWVNQFGSRFLPHTESRIRCLLPIMGDRMLLIGHDEGLSVLDMFPQEWTDGGNLVTKCQDEAHARVIWEGEA